MSSGLPEVQDSLQCYPQHGGACQSWLFICSATRGFHCLSGRHRISHGRPCSSSVPGEFIRKISSSSVIVSILFIVGVSDAVSIFLCEETPTSAIICLTSSGNYRCLYIAQNGSFFYIHIAMVMTIFINIVLCVTRVMTHWHWFCNDHWKDVERVVLGVINIEHPIRIST